MRHVGIMQGRLSPPINGRIQAFPKDSWRDEFEKAHACGLDLIEWVFEADEWERNPIFSDPAEILRMSSESGVQVLSVCADYFMDLPLIRISKSEQDRRLNLLNELILRSCCIGIEYIVIPFVDTSEIKTDDELKELVSGLRYCLPVAGRYGVQLALETSLNPMTCARLLHELDHPNAKINYDIGNSASMDYDTVEEIESCGEWIATVHVKDRLRGGNTVPLGTGSADFDATFSALARIGYEGPFILQAARDGDEVEAVKRYAEFVRQFLTKYF